MMNCLGNRNIITSAWASTLFFRNWNSEETHKRKKKKKTLRAMTNTNTIRQLEPTHMLCFSKNKKRRKNVCFCAAIFQRLSIRRVATWFPLRKFFSKIPIRLHLIRRPWIKPTNGNKINQSSLYQCSYWNDASTIFACSEKHHFFCAAESLSVLDLSIFNWTPWLLQ